MSDAAPRKIDDAVIHELSNHLTVILGFVDLVLAKIPEHHPSYPDLIAIRDAAEQAATLIGPSPPPLLQL